MSCNCIVEFEKLIVEKQLFPEIKVTEAQFDKALIFGPTGKLTSRAILEVGLTVEGRKSAVRKAVIYNYCPFCGKAFEPIEKKEEEQS